MMRQPNLLWTPIDYVSRPPLLEDFSVMNEKKVSPSWKSTDRPLSHSENMKTRNSNSRNPASHTETDKSISHQELRLKQWLQFSHELNGSHSSNISPMCRCDRENSSMQTNNDCRLHGYAIDGRKSIVLVQSSSRRNSVSESERSSSTNSSTSRDNDKETLIFDPKVKLSKNLQENHTTQTETQFNLGAWFLNTLNVPERFRERAADRNRLDIHKLPIHMKEQLKHIYVY